jgi:hypothetical protein
VDALLVGHLIQQEAQAIPLHNEPAAAAAAADVIRVVVTGSSRSMQRNQHEQHRMPGS